MKINKITLVNFRQYQNTNSITLDTKDERNIILIGGKNGYGKTNLLMAVVWCLYGEDISKIDENFRREIQKEGSYPKYLKSSLNWDAEKNGISTFSIELELSEIELPETVESPIGKSFTCRLKRTFDIITANEIFDIDIPNISNTYWNSSDSKKIFINDYIIPIEAAKFVFFDAEKIASWAELSTKEEGTVLNDALGKILGLDIYESLIKDLEIYIDSLRKESATATVKQQISSVEKGIEYNKAEIENFESEIISLDHTLQDLKQKVFHYENYLIQNNKINNSNNLPALYTKKRTLDILVKKEEDKFNELSEIIPFAIAAGKIEELHEQISKQISSEEKAFFKTEFLDKSNLLIEELFNTAPFPLDGDIPFTKKVFYSDKAKSIIEKIFGSKIEEEDNELPFEFDFTNSDIEHIKYLFTYLSNQNNEAFQKSLDSYQNIKQDLIETEKNILMIEADQQDEEIIVYTNNKQEAERKIEKLLEDKGALQSQIYHLKKSVDSDNQKLQILLKKIQVSEQKKAKLEVASKYISAIKSFVEIEKINKCSILEMNIYEEMKRLLHKLSDSTNDNFVAGVKAELLPDNDGLKISLLDNDGDIRHKESLSQGEKQIYISSLIKAILSLSIQEYPIFIDTPLGRLDDEHIKSILINYYPDLASQVIIMATNNEIPPSRYNLMKKNVSKTYLLDCKENKTIFKPGYFIAYEN